MPSKSASFIIALTVSFVLHLLVLAMILIPWGSQEKRIIAPKPNFIQARLVELKDSAKKKPPAKKKPKVVDLTKKRREAEKLKKQEEAKRQAAIKKKEAEEKKRLDAEKEKQRQLERERRLQEEAAQKEQQRLEQEAFENALREEEALLAEQVLATEAQSYSALISQRISQHWSRPPSARNGMRCELSIILVPNGRVIDVNIIKSSGSVEFDRSAVAAVKKVESFPEIREMSIELFERHFRQLTLGFQPEDLRQ